MSLDLNQANLQMRQQPWYQQWFAQRGLNPNKVQLSSAQRSDLASAMVANGMPLPKDVIIDPAGNLNTHHGFAGQPTWLKALEIGGAAAAGGYFAGPAISSMLHLGTSTVPGAVAPHLLEQSAADGFGGLVAGGGGTAGTLGGIASGLTKALPNILGAATGLYATHAATSANDKALTAQEKAQADALAYTKERDALQLAEDQKVRDLNLGLFREREGRLTPYRNFGTGSLAQLGRPIPGTLGAMAGG